MSLKPLAPEDVAAARLWLERLDQAIRDRAQSLHRANVVSELNGLGLHIGFRGRVKDGAAVFEARILSERRRIWRGECSCERGRDCEHAAALLLSALQELGMPGGRLPGAEWRQDAPVTSLHEHNVRTWKKWLAEESHGGDEGEGSPELRVRFLPHALMLEWRRPGTPDFVPLRGTPFSQLMAQMGRGVQPFEGPSAVIWGFFSSAVSGVRPEIEFVDPLAVRLLNVLLRSAEFAERIMTEDGVLLRRPEERLVWRVDAPRDPLGDYRVALALPSGEPVPEPLIVLHGRPPLYVTTEACYIAPPLGNLDPSKPALIPSAALETRDGLSFLRRIRAALPQALRDRVQVVPLKPIVRCWVEPQPFTDRELACVSARAEFAPGKTVELLGKDGWVPKPHADAAGLADFDRAALAPVLAFVEAFGGKHFAYDERWQRVVSVKFPEVFCEWLAAAPPGVTIELDPVLSSFREEAIPAQVKLEVAEAGIDWFDIRIALDVRDMTLTKKEMKALLDARGGYVRLGDKGWRRLAFQLSEEDAAQFADLGLDTRDFTSGPQRLHALQLAGKSAAKRMLPEPAARAIEQRVEEIRTRVSPGVPADLRAELRPYQVAGFHFLAYLSSNRFGGILADDMGLGKTVQTLAWLLWLRAQPGAAAHPALVVCPKSVTDNWITEAARFAPGLRVTLLRAGANDKALDQARANSDLIVLNYAQLRLLAKPLVAAPWSVVILDEAQAIKNPESQTARAAWDLKSTHRLALSGTPIENRLLDLWSIMAFAMPGVLGLRAQFSKMFDQRGDALARRRLAARVRPFVLRRTKGEVANDLPERVEEDLHCEMEGPQLTLYRAELKRARAALLKLTTQAELDEVRFNILASLLRLRQICCHPGLVAEKADDAESAKLNALLDLLEPLVEEGHKVLVFSQFVGMLDRIEREIASREWRSFKLTGETEDRGDLVQEFQQTDGAAVFLISLRAGGFGLNLTAASYVVLYDPWWNPAVENQAIDRTHRIGQVNKVIAYRLIVKDSIEEKIRSLQTQKSALAADILGEENFSRALSLDDFRFLLEE